jgi:putative SOS response-associated peptidase YedK
MCGRYRRTTAEEELARRYNIPIPTQRDLPISYNIAPTQDILAIRYHPETAQRSLDILRWGLIPYWAKDPGIAYKTINARVETVDTAPSYRHAFKKRRCLVPVDGFYEWRKVLDGKIPYSIGMQDDSPFVFAGLWEGWKNPSNNKWLHTCAIITGEPNEIVREIHTRMPVILPEKYHDAWLSGEAGKEILVPFPGELMKAWPISPKVNSPANNAPDILSPIELESEPRFDFYL